jgi:hypothetical protein
MRQSSQSSDCGVVWDADAHACLQPEALVGSELNPSADVARPSLREEEMSDGGRVHVPAYEGKVGYHRHVPCCPGTHVEAPAKLGQETQGDVAPNPTPKPMKNPSRAATWGACAAAGRPHSEDAATIAAFAPAAFGLDVLPDSAVRNRIA